MIVIPMIALKSFALLYVSFAQRFAKLFVANLLSERSALVQHADVHWKHRISQLLAKNRLSLASFRKYSQSYLLPTSRVREALLYSMQMCIENTRFCSCWGNIACHWRHSTKVRRAICCQPLEWIKRSWTACRCALKTPDSAVAGENSLVIRVTHVVHSKWI